MTNETNATNATDDGGMRSHTGASRPRPGAKVTSPACSALVIALAGTVSCAQMSRVPVDVPAIPAARVDTVVRTIVDTIRVPAPPPPPSGELAALRQQVEESRTFAESNMARAVSSDRQLRAQRMLASARGDSIKVLSADSARIDGYKEMIEGLEYVFTLSLARNMVLPAKVLPGQEVLRTTKVPALADSARVCLSGDGFKIVATAPSSDQNCSVQKLLAQSQRQWSWRVTPDSIDRKHFKDPVERVLVFTVLSYATSAEPAPDILFPVKVRIRERPLPTRIAEFLQTTTGIVTLLTALVAALGALWAAVGLGKRKGAAAAAGSGG